MFISGMEKMHLKKSLEAIKTINPDIVIFQEYTIKADRDLEQLHYNHHHFIKTAGYFGNAIFSRFPFRTIKEAFYTTTYQEPRCYIAAEIILPNNQPITIYGTHLDTFDNSEQTRHIQIQELINATSNTKNVIITGDLNSIRKEDYDTKTWGLIKNDFTNRTRQQEVPQLVSSHLKQGGFADCFSFAHLEKPKYTVWNGTVVDYILLKNWELPLAGCYVYYSNASDHLPIIMDIQLKPTAQPLQEKLLQLQRAFQGLRDKLTLLKQKLEELKTKLSHSQPTKKPSQNLIPGRNIFSSKFSRK